MFVRLSVKNLLYVLLFIVAPIQAMLPNPFHAAAMVVVPNQDDQEPPEVYMAKIHMDVELQEGIPPLRFLCFAFVRKNHAHPWIAPRLDLIPETLKLEYEAYLQHETEQAASGARLLAVALKGMTSSCVFHKNHDQCVHEKNVELYLLSIRKIMTHLKHEPPMTYYVLLKNLQSLFPYAKTEAQNKELCSSGIFLWKKLRANHRLTEERMHYEFGKLNPNLLDLGAFFLKKDLKQKQMQNESAFLGL